MRRALSIVALVALDVIGLALGIYLALVLRELVRGDGDILWSLLWREGPAEWLKFVAPITILVFAQAGLYRVRERRPGSGRILASLIVVALIVLAFGIGTGYDFSTSGLIPTAVVVCRDRDQPPARGLRVRLARAHEDDRGSAGGWCSSARESSLARPQAVAGSPRAEVSRTSSSERSRATPRPGLRLLGSRADLPRVLEEVRPDEVVLAEADFDERAVLEVVEPGAQARRPRAARPRDDGAARSARRVRPGPGRCRSSSCGPRS